jgi:transcriptional regulator NrdR family protein
MVKVLKRDKSLEAFKPAKITRSCKKAGMPEPIAKTVASMISKKVKAKKVVKSMDIMKMIFDVCDKVGKVPAAWKKYDKMKKKK